MTEQAKRLRLTLKEDGGGGEVALTEVLKSELMGVLRQFLDVEDIEISYGQREIYVKVVGDNLKKVGRYLGEF